MLADAVAGYVEGLTERELDAPLIALLYRLGFDHVHLVHGQFEFGKDFIARRIEDGIAHQYCLQSKAGDVTAGAWRDAAQQIEAMRTGSVVHPDFDPSLPRKLVLITNGRLKGAAAVEAQDYNAYHVARGEVPVEIWDIDYLVPRFEAILVEGVPAQDRARTLEMLGRLGQGRGTVQELRSYARPWFNAGLTAKDRWGHALNGAMLARAAADSGREDLAAQITFLLLRTAWESGTGHAQAAEIDVSHRLFHTLATEFWHAVRDADPVDLTTRSRSGLDAFITHPVKAARLCEQLSLLALYEYEHGDAAVAEEIAAYIGAFVDKSPAVAHVVSDDWAFSVLSTTALLMRTGRIDTARSVLRDAAVWALDWIEYGSGLARAGDPAPLAVKQLLGSPYSSLRAVSDPSSYTLSVVLDLAYVFGFNNLYEDLVNDVDAVGAIATVILERALDDAELLARVRYSPNDDPPAEHHSVPADRSPAGGAAAWFDCLARWATLRDRHIPSVVRAIVAPPGSP